MEIEIEIRAMLLTTRFPKARPGHILNNMENLGSLKSFPNPTGKGLSYSPPRKFCPYYQIWSTKSATSKDWKKLFEVFELSEAAASLLLALFGPCKNLK